MSDTTLITDIHTHVLFNVDDGPNALEDSLRLLQAHQEAGTQRLFCTSHLGSPHFHNSLEDLAQSFAALSRTVSETREQDAYSDCSGPDTVDNTETTHLATSLYPLFVYGAEVRVNMDLAARLQRNEVPALGDTSYVLLEYPNNELNERMLDIVHEFKVRGFQPIMAHPERCIVIQKDPHWLDALLETGLLLQLTAACLEQPPTNRSHMADKLAWAILERGAASVIASDAHHPLYRPPGLITAYETIASRFGSEVSDNLIANANAIWNNEPTRRVTVSRRKRSLFRR